MPDSNHSGAWATLRCPRSHPRQRGSAAAWILSLIILGGIAFAIYWFVIRKDTGASSSLAARVLPAEVDVVGGVDIARLLSEPAVREAAKKAGSDLDALDAELAKLNIKREDLKSLVFGGKVSASAPTLEGAIVAVEAATDAKAAVAGMQALLQLAPERFRSIISGGRVEALDGGIVITGSNDLLDKALAVAKGQGTPLGEVPGLDDIRKALDTGGMIWGAAAIPQTVLGFLPGMAKNMLGGTPTHVGFSVTWGDPIVVRGAIHIPGADGAKVASSMEMLLGLAKSRLDPAQKIVAETLELSGDGATVIATAKLTQAQLGELAQRGN